MEIDRLQPVVGERVWTGPQLASTPERWTHTLSAAAIDELDTVVARCREQQTPLLDIRYDDYELSALRTTLLDVRRELQDGVGFALLRGLPVERYSLADAAAAYFVIGAFFGEAVSQNAKGHALGHVRDLGVDPTTPTGRGYQSSHKLNFHTDPTDVVGLLCINKARRGGESAIVSAGTVYNAVLAESPELAHVLTQTFYRDRRGEIPAGRDPWYRLPIFNFKDGRLLTNFVRSTIEKAQRFDAVPRLTDAQRAAFELMERHAGSPHHYLKMAFEPGDIQLLNNHYILHSRSAYEDYAEPERRRHLLRLWLACADGPALPSPYFEFMDKTEAGRPNGYLMPGVVLSTPLGVEDGGPGESAQRM
ncbi:MAG: TauD/TfdA family dioxygenase [Pseudomonadota bacterium]